MQAQVPKKGSLIEKGVSPQLIFLFLILDFLQYSGTARHQSQKNVLDPFQPVLDNLPNVK